MKTTHAAFMPRLSVSGDIPMLIDMPSWHVQGRFYLKFTVLIDDHLQ